MLEKLRAQKKLTTKELITHDKGLVSLLLQLHDDLDLAVVEAYGLDPQATDEQILTFLCKLNAERAAEERAGHIRWLRPSFQNPTAANTQTTLIGDPETTTAPVTQAVKFLWPKTLAEQAKAVRTALSKATGPADAIKLATQFKSARVERIDELLATLSSLGQARELPNGQYEADS